AQGRDSMDGALQRQLDLVEKRLADLNMGQDEERRVRPEETAALEQKLRDMHHAPHVVIPATTDLPLMDLNATPRRPATAPVDDLPSRDKAPTTTRGRITPTPVASVHPSGAPLGPTRLQLSSLSLWRCKLGRLFCAWRLYVQLHHNLHLLHFQRVRRHARLMLTLWRQYCERQFHVRLFAASRDHNGLVRCFHKWANASRFHAITKFAAGRRARDRLVTVIHGWRRWSRQANRIRLAQARQQHRRDSNTLHGVVAAWRQHTYMHSVRRIHEKQLHRMHAKFTLHAAFQGWRRWLDRHHCRIKLERRVWHAWATATATHLVVRKQHKRSALTLAFHSFRVAVRKQSARRHVLRRTDHLATRQALHWVQQCMTR
ncbi:hypothetical protein DYB31_016596, partial [Aphanomyces astaci]